MPTGQLTTLIQNLRKSAILRDGESLTDAELLSAFISHRDETTFEVLVRRHGPMVLGVCRRLLGNVQDAEDAFQATFIVLVRKGASVVPREAVGNWLYGVAFRTALAARRASLQRGAKEKQVKDMPHPQVDSGESWEGLQPLLDQELNGLPDKYRLPLVLCDMEGRTRREVARELKIPDGTLSNRLATARKLLAKRLARHGIAYSGGAIATILSQNAVSACVPASLVGTTVEAASSIAAGNAVGTAIVSAKAAALAEGVVKAMLLTRLKTVMISLLVVGLIVLGGGLLTYHNTAAAQQGRVANPVGEKEAEGDKPKNSTTSSILFGLRKLNAIRTISVSVFGTKSEIEDLPLAADVQVLFHVGMGMGKSKGKLTDLGVEGQPLTLNFAPDGKTVTRITAYMSLSPRFLMEEVDAEQKTISTAPMWNGFRERLAVVPDVEVFIDGKKKTFGELRKGMIVDVIPAPLQEVDAKHAAVLNRPPPLTTTMRFDLKRHGPFYKIDAYSEVIDGVVAAVDADKNTLSLTLAGTGLLVKNLPVAADARIVIAGKKRRLSDVKPQTSVTVELLGEDDTPRERRIVSVLARPKPAFQEKDPTKEELQKLQGTWNMVEAERHGKKVAAKDLPTEEISYKSEALVIAGEKIERQLNGKPGPRVDFTFNATKKPKEITISWLIETRAIYKLDGDTLTMCFNLSADDRPDEFRTQADSDRWLFVYRRALPKDFPKWFKELDEDGDGQVALYEWRKSGKSFEEFRQYDFNDDGFITVDEVIRYLQNNPIKP
jgi:RNA polymerase sigma factor (sigma-70 family)